MPIEYTSYKKFTDQESAEEITNLLRENGIECHLQDNLHHYVKAIGAHQVDFAVILNIKTDDFIKADKILAAHYLKAIEDVDKTYYLFEFTDEELKDIISNPYDWGNFDFQLAKKILKEKGIEYSDSYIESKKEEKINELSRIKKIPVYKLVAGYLLAFFLPPVGMINGFLIVNNRNILPNGQKFYIHSEADRKQGRIIIAVSIIWALIIFWGSIKEQFR